jgi:hypothetical protein
MIEMDTGLMDSIEHILGENGMNTALAIAECDRLDTLIGNIVAHRLALRLDRELMGERNGST